MVRMQVAKYPDGFVIGIEDYELVLSPEAYSQLMVTLTRAEVAPAGHVAAFVLDPDEDVPDTDFMVGDDY